MGNAIQLSPETAAKAEAAQQAWGVLRKTLQQWIVIGAGIAALRDRANDVGGRDTFKRLLEQQGLGALVKAKAITSRLERIMQPENLPEVMAWHQKLDEKQQIAWGSPTSVIRHCPIFAKAGSQPAGRRQPVKVTPGALEREIERQEARIGELQQELETAKQAQSATSLREIWKGKDWSEMIGDMIAAMRRDRFETLVKEASRVIEEEQHHAIYRAAREAREAGKKPAVEPARDPKAVRDPKGEVFGKFTLRT